MAADVATITITLTMPEGTDGEDPKIMSALVDLASVMMVQAEDGLFTAGAEDASIENNEHLLDFSIMRSHVEVW